MKKKKKQRTKVSEQDLLDTIDIIAKKLAYKFKFGYHELEDMKQQISIFALEGIENYDNDRPLENFLWTHVRNRLFNYKRDNYQRPDVPCLKCPLHDKLCANKDNDCTAFQNKLDCEIYKSWNVRNSTKKNLMYLHTIEDLKEYLPQKHSFISKIENNEMIQFLDEVLHGEHRTIYLKIKYGNKVYKHEINRLIAKIKEITND